ncbi:hypothetical protein CSQ96_01750 [Janthinobacterium sp. BJB412]|nr:hypothetical protein CSQ96_01750 [Janthinobacterium sp. BJB412]
MQVNFIAQPQQQLGVLLQAILAAPARPTRVTIVSAFASLQAVLRLKARLEELHADATVVRIVIGVDMGGTSQEVLYELAQWPIEVFVFKNRKSGVTFHPKLYIVEFEELAEIFLGSNNLTDGGLYGNYEGAVRVTYAFPEDHAEFAKAKEQLAKFIEPGAPVSRRLDESYLEILKARTEIPSDAEARQRRKTARGQPQDKVDGVEAFGFESTPGPAILPLEVQAVVMAALRDQIEGLNAAQKKAKAERKAAAKAAAAAGVENEAAVQPAAPDKDFRSLVPLAQIVPQAFYLELTATQGAEGKIPGEQRIPLEAINSAQEFWGWPDYYTEKINPRKGPDAPGEKRIYIEWKPVWRVHSMHDASKDVTTAVRMYYYVNNSDFRFHSGALVNWAKAGDIVRIIRCDDAAYVFDCALALAGTSEHAEWKAQCTASSERSPRVFGFS